MSTPIPKPPVVIFLSAVSREFHEGDPADPRGFVSYRAHLTESLRAMRQPHEIVTQEDALRRADPGALPGQLGVVSQENLAQGFGDLLGTLDREIREATVVVHLVGDMAGAIPEETARQRLLGDYPDLLSHAPKLRESLLNDLNEISYTQWELWLAFHHQAKPLVFFATPGAPRSPAMAEEMEDLARQLRHRERIQATDKHRSSFTDQKDVVSQTIRVLIREGLTADPGQAEPAPEALKEARKLLEKIVPEIAARIKAPDPARFYVADRAGIAAWVAALDAVAEMYQLNRQAVVSLLDERLGYLLERAEASREAEVHLDLAFTFLALGEYGAAIRAAERAAGLAPGKASKDGPNETFLNAQNLIADAALANHDPARAMHAYQVGGGQIDKKSHPILWADFHEPFARFCVEHAQWEEADGLISDILDIREDHAEESPVELAKTLNLWAILLCVLGKYQSAYDVSRRSAGIYEGLMPPDFSGASVGWSMQGAALTSLGRFAEAEPLTHRALATAEELYGKDHPSVASCLNNLATVLKDTNRAKDAESLLRRALAIQQAHFSSDHPKVALALHNLATVLQDMNELTEAEPLIRRALAIDEVAFGKHHPNVARNLCSLAGLLTATDRQTDAEPLIRRALAIDEASFGSHHPNIAIRLNNLAQLLSDTQRVKEAEPLIRRAIRILVMSLGVTHPTTQSVMLNCVVMLRKAGMKQSEILKWLDAAVKNDQ